MICYPGTVSVSHMPLSHITDRHGVYTTLFSGGRIGVYEATTHDGPGDLFSGWLRRLGPTVLKGSPRHFTTLMDMWKDSGEPIETWRANEPLGPRIKVLISGGAHLASETKRFLQMGFGSHVQVVDGFGSTESGNITTNGVLTDGTQVKLLDVPKLRYFSTDRPLPRGELLVKTRAPFEGYFRDKHKSGESLDADGWYHTGDIVSYDAEQRRIEVLGRAKFAIKLANAEFVSPERVEAILEAGSPLVHRIFVHGDDETHFIVGIVSIDADGVRQWWAERAGKALAADVTVETMAQLDGLRGALTAEFVRLGKEAGSSDWEILRRFLIAPASFSEQTGTVGARFFVYEILVKGQQNQ